MKTTLSEKIATLRRQRGLTLEELGNKVGVGKSTVRKWETGMITSIRSDKLTALADTLEVDVAELLSTDSNTCIGTNIRQRRKELGMTQAELAEKLGCQKAAISKIELGAVDVAVSKLPAFAAALETGVGELLVWMIRGEGEKGC